MLIVKQRVYSDQKQPCIKNLWRPHWWERAPSGNGGERNKNHEVQFECKIDHEFEGLSDAKTTQWVFPSA